MKWLGPIAGERMLSNGPATEMASVNLIRPTGVNRSQDDAMVGYFFQRPQTDPDFQHYTKQPTRWAIGDDSAIEARHGEAAEMENDFQALALETGHQPLEIAPSAKKLWGVEESGKPDEIKSIFLGNQWRDAPWSTGHMSEHVVSQPIMMQRRSGSYPGGDINSVLSPRSSETGGLGVKMVEYVLGTSPTTAKDMDARMARLTLNVGDADDKGKKDQTQPPFDGGKTKDQENSNAGQTNGIVQNGLEDDKSFNRTPGSRQPSPNEEDMNKNPGLCDMGRLPKTDDLLPNQAQIMPQSSLPFDSRMEPMAIDPIAFDYPSQLMQSMDSPNVIDYNHMYQRQQQQQQQPSIAMLTQQQYALAAQQQQQQQQLGMPPAPFTSNSYIINQDPYAQVGPMMPGGNAPYSGPTVMPPYYGMPPWGMCAPNMLQQQQGAPQGSVSQQQQHMLRGNGARPMTPQQSGGNDGLGGPGPGGMPQSVQTAGGQYPVITQAYYDQNSSQMVMSNRNVNGPMRLVSPAPVVVNPNQPGNIGNNSLRMMSNQAQQMQNHSSAMYSGSAPAGQNNMYTPTTSGLNFPQATSSMGFSGNSSSSLNFNHTQQNSSLGYGNNTLGTIGTPSMGAIGNEWDLSVPNVVAVGLGNTSGGSQRRDSFDRRDNAGFSAGLDIQRQMPKGPQYYGVLGAVTPSPGPIGVMPPSNQSLTPPPSLSGSSSNLSLGALMSGNRIISAAPGAETKYRNGTITPNMLSSSSLFPMRTLQRNSSLEKPMGRSRLLEDFRNNRFPNLQLRDLVHHIVEFSQDQHGSRFIQQKLERATSTEKQMVFNEILTAAYNLMTDVFGNYVIQKFFEFGTPEQKQTLAQKVRGHVLPLALQMYGCRVIQKALESIPPDQQKDVVKELDGHVLKCVKDQNGNHVVQKCIECVDPMALQFIINAFQGQVYTLSTHPYGCRVIQRILEHCTSDQTSPILEELHGNTEQLVQDQYGNYVIQHVLEHGRTEDKSKIVAVIRGKVLQLSQHKFASNVVEKCITHATRAERAMLIEEVCAYIDGPHSALYTMMKDQFANYVVQKMIDVAESPQRKSLMHKIRPHIVTLRKFTYGKHILAKLEKHMMKSNDLGPIGAPSNGGM